MEIGSVKESNYRGENLLNPQSSLSQIEPRLVDTAAADGVQGTESCDHFSIRGYVAEIRKKDPKICWPFPMFHGQTSDKNISLLPPLPMTKFRRWNCQNCWHKAINCAVTRANEAPSDIQNAEVKSGTIFLRNTFMTHANDKEMLPGFHQLSEEKIVDGGLTEAGSSVNVPNGECCPSAICDKNTKNYLTGAATEGLQVAKASQGSYEGIQNLSTDKLAYVETKDEACHMGGRGERNVASTANTLEALYSEDMVNAKSKETEIINKSTDFRMVASPACIDSMVHGEKDEQLVRETGKTIQQFKKAAGETETPPEKKIAAQQVDSQTAVAAYLSELDSKGLDENDDKTSDINVTLPQDTVQSQNGAMQVGFSDGNLQHKKSRKMRLLDEIMRTKELNSSSKIHISDGSEDANQIEDRIDRRPPTSRRKDPELGPEIHDTSHKKTKVKSCKRKRRYIDFENLDDGSSLMYWVKKARDEAKTKRRYKHLDAAADASAENRLVNSLKVCGAKEHKQNPIRMQSAMHQSCLMPQQQNKTNKDIFIADGQATKQLNARTIHSKSKRTIKARRSLLCGPSTRSNTNEKVSLRKKKREHHVANEGSGKMHLPMGQKNVIEERETTQTCAHEALDDIPMDIVELLAKNKQERRLMNAKAAMANTHNVLERTEIMEDNHVLDVNEGHGDKVPAALHENVSQQKTVWNIKGNSVWTAVRSDKNADESMKLSDYATSHGRKNDHVNLNQEELVSASTGSLTPLQCRGHPSLPMTDSTKNCHSQHHSWSKMGMQTSESCHKGQEILGQNTFRNALGESSMLLSRTPFGINTEKVSADYSHMNMFGYNTLLQEKPTAVDFLKTTDQAKSHLQNRKENAEVSVHNRSFPAVTSFAEPGNTSNSEMVRPQDLYTNESIPAMHLLKLMDSAKWSGMSLQDLPNTNHKGTPWESDLSSTAQCEKEMIGLGPRGKSNQAANPPLVVQHPNQVQHQENSCKPYRPLPRRGVYGSLLQKEITSPPDNSGTFRIGYSSKMTSLEASRKDNSELSYSANKAGVLNAHARLPPSRNENSESPFSVVNSNVHCAWYSSRNDITGEGTSSKGIAVQPLNNRCEKEICVVNRNPADFTIVDGNNEYMIGSDDIWPRPTTPTVNPQSIVHPNGQRRQKVRRVTTLNGLMRS